MNQVRFLSSKGGLAALRCNHKRLLSRISYSNAKNVGSFNAILRLIHRQRLLNTFVSKRFNSNSNINHEHRYPQRYHHPALTPPRPVTRKEFVASATSVLHSLELNLKWLLIKQNRPFNADDFSAFISWFVWSNILWLVLGTTTFVSLIVYALKTLKINNGNPDQASFVDNLILKMLFKYDSEKIIFKFNRTKDGEDNVVPNFRKNVISFKNVTICSTDKLASDAVKFELNIDKFDITLNFNKWNQNKGLINNIDIDGVTGILHNDLLDFGTDPQNKEYLTKLIKIMFKNNEYEFNGIKLQNVHIDYSSRNLAKPIKFSIFNLEIPRLRFNWFLIDVLKPKICSGSINNSLFTIHQKQHKHSQHMLKSDQQFLDLSNLKSVSNEVNAVFGDTKQNGNHGNESENEETTTTRIQVHAIDLKTNPLLANKFGWIVDGKVNLICDINLSNEKNFNVNELIEELKSKVNKELLKIDSNNIQDAIGNISATELIAEPHQFYNYNNLFHEARIDDDLAVFNPKKVSPASKSAVLCASKEEEEKAIANSNTLTLPQFNGKESQLNFLNNKITIEPLAKPASDNRYVLVNLKIQFVNAVAKIPKEAPTSELTKKPYISLDDLRPIIALINNSPSSHSFFSNKTGSILNSSEVTPLESAVSTMASSSQVLNNNTNNSNSNTNSLIGSNDYGGIHDELPTQDKQFTLSSSTIYNLDKLYSKVAITETNLVDLIVADLYEDLVKNLHYELNSRLINSYGNYYNFNLNHLVSALSKNAKILTAFGDDDGDRLFGIVDHKNKYKISLLILLGLGALF